jgi:hypothetical protein
MVKFVKVLAAADEKYRANQAKWTADSPEVKAVAKWSGAKPEDVPAGMALYRFPTLAEQNGKWLGGGKSSLAAKALAATAQFQLSQKQIEKTLPDYSAVVTDLYAMDAMKLRLSRQRTKFAWIGRRTAPDLRRRSADISLRHARIVAPREALDSPHRRGADPAAARCTSRQRRRPGRRLDRRGTWRGQEHAGRDLGHGTRRPPAVASRRRRRRGSRRCLCLLPAARGGLPPLPTPAAVQSP